MWLLSVSLCLPIGMLEAYTTDLYFRFSPLSRRALVMTETELKDMAAPAIMGLNKTPINGYSIPAAIGILIAL